MPHLDRGKFAISCSSKTTLQFYVRNSHDDNSTSCHSPKRCSAVVLLLVTVYVSCCTRGIATFADLLLSCKAWKVKFVEKKSREWFSADATRRLMPYNECIAFRVFLCAASVHEDLNCGVYDPNCFACTPSKPHYPALGYAQKDLQMCGNHLVLGSKLF